jgi:hypothetical protein
MLRREDALDRFANFAADGGVLRGQVQLRNRFLRSGDVRVYAHTESVSQNRAIALRQREWPLCRSPEYQFQQLRPGRLGRSSAAPVRGLVGGVCGGAAGILLVPGTAIRLAAREIAGRLDMPNE